METVQPLSIFLYYLLIQCVNLHYINPLNYYFNGTQLTGNLKANQGKSYPFRPKNAVSIVQDLSPASLLQAVTPNSSKFSPNFSPERLFFINLVLVFEPDNDIKCPNNDLLTDWIKPTIFAINEKFNQIGFSVILIDYLILNHTEESLDNFQNYRDANWPQYQNFTVVLVRTVKAIQTDSYTRRRGCKSTSIANIVSNPYPNSSALAITRLFGLSHGLEYDAASCGSCDNYLCIMHNGTVKYPLLPSDYQKWSKCSINYLAELFTSGLIDCILNAPPTHVQYCGNGLIDENEECDCGSSDCGSCCDGKTCKLTPNAVCGSGPCCDLSTCQPIDASKNIMCRNNLTECDLPEYCDGSSPNCPANLNAPDRTPCSWGGFCYHGFCRSHSLSCKSIFSESVEKSDPICYEQNAKGTNDFNCGVIQGVPVPCKGRSIECGKLFCNVSKTTATRIPTLLTTRPSPGLSDCLIINPNIFSTNDMSRVADGSPCASHSWCINGACIPFNPCPSDCSGNGDCDQSGQCHCYAGFASNDCSERVDNINTNSTNSTTTAEYTGNVTSNTISLIILIALVSIAVFVSMVAYLRYKSREDSIMNKVKSLTTMRGTDRTANTSATTLSKRSGLSTNSTVSKTLSGMKRNGLFASDLAVSNTMESRYSKNFDQYKTGLSVSKTFDETPKISGVFGSNSIEQKTKKSMSSKGKAEKSTGTKSVASKDIEQKTIQSKTSGNLSSQYGSAKSKSLAPSSTSPNSKVLFPSDSSQSKETRAKLVMQSRSTVDKYKHKYK